MSKRYALLDADGTVVNVILWDGETPYTSSEKAVEIPADLAVSIGWTRTAEGWAIPPEPEVPESPVDPNEALQAQAVQKLMALGLTEDEAKAIAGL